MAMSVARSLLYSRRTLPKLPRVSGAEAVRALERLGFIRVRQRGSHVVMKRVQRDATHGCVVPLHPELAIGTLRGIMKQAMVTVEEFSRAL